MNDKTVRDAPECFDSFADLYERWVTAQNWAPWLSGNTAGGDRALDAGCGAGHTAEWLAGKFREVVAFDLSSPLISLAEARHGKPNIRYAVADLFEFSDPSGFDLVWSHTMMHHLKDYSGGLARLRSLAKPGGRVVIIDNVYDGNRTPPRRAYTLPAKLRFLPDLSTKGLSRALLEYRFWHDERWLAHLASDRYLTRAEFRAAYGKEFPGTEFHDLGFAMVSDWTAP